MFSITSKIKLPKNLMFCSLLLLAACGGGAGNPEPTPGPTPGPTPDPGPPAITLAATYTDIVEGTALGQANWAEGSGTGSPIDDVTCLLDDKYHIHSMISIYRNGTRLQVPAQIGLKGCSYELHTHDGSGVVHVETTVQKKFTVGQFFSVWGQPLGISNVAGLTGSTPHFYVIENETVTPYTGNPADIELAEHREIAIVIGTPPAAFMKHRWPTSL